MQSASAVQSICTSIVLGVLAVGLIVARMIGSNDSVIEPITGLGIAAIAVALLAPAMQWREPLLALGADCSPRPRDQPKIDQTTGTVELTGLRARPARDPARGMRFEVHLRLGLAPSRRLYDTRARMEAMLACLPAIAGDPPSVLPARPGDAWFDLEAMASFDAPDWASFQVVCDRLLLACLDIVGVPARS